MRTFTTQALTFCIILGGLGTQLTAATPDLDSWVLGSFIKQHGQHSYSWEIGEQSYQAIKSQKFPLGTIKFSIEKKQTNGHALKLGLLKIKSINSIVFKEYAFKPGDKDKSFELIGQANTKISIRFQIKLNGEFVLFQKEALIENGRAYLNFQGRANTPSTRNCILQTYPRRDEAVRIGHLAGQPYSLDYVPSRCTPALALAFAVAVWNIQKTD